MKFWLSAFVALIASLLLVSTASAAQTACQIANGCTGTSTAPSYGSLLIGGNHGEYEYVASSTLLAGLTVSNFASPNVSQWTNDADYLTSLAGAASSTLLTDNNTFSGIDNFTNSSSNFGGTWQTFSPSYFQTALTFSTGLTNTAGTVTNNLSTGVAGGQSVVGGTNANDNLTLVSNNSGTPGNIYFGASQQAWYNANQTFFEIQSPNQGTVVATTSGMYLQNPTAAAAGAQQASPFLTFEGQGWATSGTASSTPVEISQYLLPVQGTTIPSANLVWLRNISQSNFTTIMTLTSNGTLEPNNLESVGILGTTNTTNGNFWAPGAASITHEALGQYTIGTSSSSGIGIRTGFYGVTGTVLTVGDNYAANVMSGTPVTLAASGVHNWLTTLAIKPPFVIGGAAKVWNTATLYIDGASTSTVNGLNYDFYASSTAPDYFGGNVGIATTAPAERLDVNGNIYVEGAADGIILKDTSSAGCYIIQVTSGVVVATSHTCN